MAIKLTKPEIDELLVGRSSCITDRGTYRDGYLDSINQLYPFTEMFTDDRIRGFSKGFWSDLDHYTFKSPLQCSEGEDILNGILYYSSRVNVEPKIWQPRIINVSALTDTHIRTADEYLEAVSKATRKKGMIDEGTIVGIMVAKTGEMVKLTKLENSVIVLPSQKFVEYCISKRR